MPKLGYTPENLEMCTSEIESESIFMFQTSLRTYITVKQHFLLRILLCMPTMLVR